MILKITRKYRKEDVEIIRKAIRRKYGRMEKVKKLMQIKKCTMPEVGEAYLYYLALEDGEIEEEVTIEDKKVLNSLTAKRFEIIEFLNRHEPMSLKELSSRVKRDYKNVYDDVSALSTYYVLNTIRFGRESVPVGIIDSVEIRV